MSAKTLVVAAIGAGCIIAAGAGGFIALRLNRADHALAETGAPNAPAAVTPPSTPSSSPAAAAAPDAASPPPSPSVTPAPPVASPTNAAAPKPARQPTKSVAPTPVPAPPVASPPPDDQNPPPVAPVTLPATVAPPPPDQQATAADGPPADLKPILDDVVVKTDSVIGLALDTSVSSNTARIEDKITAHVTRDVMVDGRVAVPANSRLEGVVTAVQKGGKFKQAARIGIRFTTLYFPSNTKYLIQTEPIFRDGEAPGNEATAKVGAGAVVGTILGALIGGKKGAAVGAAAGAGGGAAATAGGHASEAVFQSGVPMSVRLSAPVTVSIPRDQNQ